MNSHDSVFLLVHMMFLREFVTCFVELMESFIRSSSRKNPNIATHVPPMQPSEYKTPYGMKVIWTLPGVTTLTLHLKDKLKIKNGKRWSQCMYMHYLLDFKMKKEHLENEEKTFILTLDGDTQFQPISVLRLVERIRDCPDVGAICGFTRPAGSSILSWFQKFEYGVQHWLAKGTEEAAGTVFCAPGCYSILRAKAIVKSDIIATFSAEATQPTHFLKYDQGEDRWLITLLLKKGWRTKYMAVCDAYTYCPNTIADYFKSFQNNI